jgi:regulator of protease activity HflC (stomatin/prohibitin superfamily)
VILGIGDFYRKALVMPDILIALLILVILALLIIRRSTVLEYQKGLLYSHGKFIRILEPGEHFYLSIFQTITKIDIRTANVTLAGQEMLTSDNVGIKISLAASFRVSDAYIAINKVINYQESLYLLLQLSLRDIIGSLEVEELLSKRADISKQLHDNSLSQVSALGVELISVSIKDIMFPGELKNIFAQVVNAKKEGLAALERARGESASLRNLANAAREFDNNPNLMQLRLLQVLEKSSGNTFLLMPPESSGINKLVTTSAGKTKNSKV